MSEKPYHLLPSRTQRQLYKALFRIRLAGYRHMHRAEARASGGLSDQERLALIGVVPDGAHVSSGVHSAGRIPVSVRTYRALAHRGYVMKWSVASRHRRPVVAVVDPVCVKTRRRRNAIATYPPAVRQHNPSRGACAEPHSAGARVWRLLEAALGAGLAEPRGATVDGDPQIRRSTCANGCFGR